MRILKLLFIFSMLTIAGCDKEDRDILNESPIDSIIQIEAKEIATGGSNSILLRCRTEKNYACFNNTILTSKQVKQNSIEITFEAIKGAEICATAIGPATTEINLGALTVGQYELRLNTANFQNTGLLKITSTEITLEFGPINGIDILTPVVKR